MYNHTNQLKNSRNLTKMERIILEPETEKNFKLKHDFIEENAPPNEVKVINKV